jgi:alpha-galactosidase
MSESQAIEKIISAPRAGAEILAADLFHAEWERARAVPLVRYWSGDVAPPERHAEARLLWSEEALTVRFLCRQSEPLVISDEPQTAEKSLRLWERDVCEIFIAPERNEPERYFEFEAAPTGEWIDLEIRWKPEGRETDWHYHSGMTAAAAVEDERIVIAMRVPWEAFRRRPQAGELWRVNLFRCVGRGAERGYLAWQPTRTAEPNFHVPQAFGGLRFDP